MAPPSAEPPSRPEGLIEIVLTYDRFANAKRVAQPFHIVTPLSKVPCCRIIAAAAAIAAVIVVDDLRYVAQGRKRGFEAAMVEPGTSMQQEKGWLFAHLVTLGDQARVLHIDVKFDTVHVYKHDLDTGVVMDLA